MNMYLLIIVGVMLQIINLNFKSKFTIASSATAIIVGFLVILTPLFVFNFISKNQHKLTNPQFVKKYGTFFDEFK